MINIGWNLEDMSNILFFKVTHVIVKSCVVFFYISI